MSKPENNLLLITLTPSQRASLAALKLETGLSMRQLIRQCIQRALPEVRSILLPSEPGQAKEQK